MMLSQSGLDALTKREGLKLLPYRDSAGLETIGVGHLLTRDELSSGKLMAPVEWRPGITAAQAEYLLRQDAIVAGRAVDTLVKVPLTANQYDALVSFVFNVGVGAFTGSTLLWRLNIGRYGDVPTQLRRWTYAGGKSVQGLVNRRESEIVQWNTP